MRGGGLALLGLGGYALAWLFFAFIVMTLLASCLQWVARLWVSSLLTEHCMS